MSPVIVFVPGFWVGPEPFTILGERLSAAGLQVETAQLPSTGTTSPGNPSMKDDIAAVRKHIVSVLDRSEDVVLVLHSAGGFIGGAAADGLTKQERGSTKSGVTQVVFLSGAVFPAGHQHQPLPFAVVEGGASYCAQPEKLLFGDLSDEDQARWVKSLKAQPAQGWDEIIPAAPWAHVPSTYVVCEKDAILPVSLQEQLAAAAGSQVKRVAAGHMPMIGASSELAEIIQAVATA